MHPGLPAGLRRRSLLAATGAGLLAPAQATPWAGPALLPSIDARPERLIDIAVCTRPFRAQGPRIEAERRGRQTIIHNYGHGGSGWSLSWGAARLAVDMALATRERQIAIIGCGAIGLTSACVAQRAGLRVRILCRERPPEVRSSAATGVWTPSSRICLEAHATEAFQQRWAAMARYSFRSYQNLLGLAGDPVEWRDGYSLYDERLPEDEHGGHGPNEPEYASLGDAAPELRIPSALVPAGEHPFAVTRVRRFTQIMFNLPAYQRLLMDDFLRAGGVIEQREFTHPRQLAGLRERTLLNATGYGARELFGDTSLTPVRGQTARLIPQPEVRYGINFRQRNLSVVSRRDGILVQAQAEGDYGSEDTTPDRAASVAAVQRLAELFKG
jgi:glycine/D-amino acid oxidase-like deaminating enzyme